MSIVPMEARGHQIPLELELQVTLGHMILVLGTNSGFLQSALDF